MKTIEAKGLADVVDSELRTERQTSSQVSTARNRLREEGQTHVLETLFKLGPHVLAVHGVVLGRDVELFSLDARELHGLPDRGLVGIDAGVVEVPVPVLEGEDDVSGRVFLVESASYTEGGTDEGGGMPSARHVQDEGRKATFGRTWG